MPFPHLDKEEALVRSRRYCCVCHEFAGLYTNVHHIIPEAQGGPNTLDNAIVLCLRCHGEAGHYNPRHPIGNKYSPAELRRHRDLWWERCEQHAGVPLSPHDLDASLQLSLNLFQLGRDQRHKDEVTFGQRKHSPSHFRFGFALENAAPIIAQEIYIKASFYWRGDYPRKALQIQAPLNAKGWTTDVSQLVNEQWAIVIFDGGTEFKCLFGHPIRWKNFSIRLEERVNGYFDISYTVSSVRPYTRRNGKLRINME